MNIRPFVKRMIKELSKDFEIIVFTNMDRELAEPILNCIDKHNQISYKLYREHCLGTHNGWIFKDLRIFKGRIRENMCLIDSTGFQFGYNIDLWVPIIPFYDNKFDRELLGLTKYLKSLLDKDIASTNTKTFQLLEMTD